MPATVALYGSGQGCTANTDHHGLARFHVLRQTFQCDPRPFFSGIDHVIARRRVDGNRHRVEIDGHTVATGCMVVAVICGDGDGQAVLPLNQRFQLVAADARLPAPARANLRGKRLTIDLQLYGRARLNMAAGTADGQGLIQFDGVNDVITGDDVHAETRQVSADHECPVSRGAVAAEVGHGGGDIHFGVAQRLQLRGGHFPLPAQIAFNDSVAQQNAVQRNSDGIARFRIADRTGDVLALRHVVHAQQVIASDGIQRHHWR